RTHSGSRGGKPVARCTHGDFTAVADVVSLQVLQHHSVSSVRMAQQDHPNESCDTLAIRLGTGGKVALEPNSPVAKAPKALFPQHHTERSSRMAQLVEASKATSATRSSRDSSSASPYTGLAT